MTKNTQIPAAKTIAAYITENSPKGAKCIEADFITIKGLSILAWVSEIPCSTAQGYYQAFGSICHDGKFDEVQCSKPCQYYGDKDHRIITTGTFITSSFVEEKGQPKDQLLTVGKASSDEISAKITLVCQGKSISNFILRGQCDRVKA